MSPASVPGPGPDGEQLRTLLRHDGRRLRGALRRPSLGGLAVVLVPVLALAGALWAVGGAAAVDTAGIGGGAALGLLVSAPLAILAFGTLFGGDDRAFLRRLGVEAPAFLGERSLRLLAAALAPALLLVVPILAAGEPAARPLVLGAAAALAGWGTAVASLAFAARAVSRPGARPGLLATGMWDRELARMAPLVYAPVAPLLAGVAAAAWVGGAAGAGWARLLPVALGAAALALAAARPFRAAYPRFVAQLNEAAFSPPPAAAEETLRVGRGATGLLPRRAAAAWVRDAVVAGRRFAWAGRIVWPVAIVAIAALARWGAQPSARLWAAAAVLGALLVQAAAILALGRLEGAGRRWIDRSLGIAWHHRLLGRWAWGWGLSLWLLVPFALAWGWWAAAGPGWPWLLAGLFTSGMAAVASLFVSGWR
jgi:hypothetical protein